MIVHQVEQGSAEWLQLRLGIPTASMFHKILTPTGKLSKQAAGYMNFLIASWILKAPIQTYESDYMTRGKEHEPAARKAFAFEKGMEVEQVGFVTNDDGTMGASPDGLVGQNATLELKVPAPHTHVGYMIAQGVDDDYHVQIQGQLYICERDLCYVQSFCPDFPSVIIEAGRDEAFIKNLSIALDAFNETMLKAREALIQKYGNFEKPTLAPALEEIGALGVTDADVAAIWAARESR